MKIYFVWDVFHPKHLFPVRADSRGDAIRFFFQLAPFGFASVMRNLRAKVIR